MMSMRSDWLDALAFERNYEVVSAVNTLSIHAKLALDGFPDPTPPEEVQGAREQLLEFLKELEIAVRQAQGDGTITGIDPHLGEVASRYVKRLRRRSDKRGAAELLVDFARLIGAEAPGGRLRLVEELHELRSCIALRMPAGPLGMR
jgi:hypothetical protein